MSFVCRMQLTLESLSNMSFLFLIVETIDISGVFWCIYYGNDAMFYHM